QGGHGRRLCDRGAEVTSFPRNIVDSQDNGYEVVIRYNVGPAAAAPPRGLPMGLTALLVLAVTSFAAATVNGALGYGYSPISVPIALLVTVGRVLNPALVIVEV